MRTVTYNGTTTITNSDRNLCPLSSESTIIFDEDGDGTISSLLPTTHYGTPWENTPSMNFILKVLPSSLRFGHTSNITQVLLSQNSNDGGAVETDTNIIHDYLLGIISMIIFFFVIFVLYMVLLRSIRSLSKCCFRSTNNNGSIVCNIIMGKSLATVALQDDEQQQEQERKAKKSFEDNGDDSLSSDDDATHQIDLSLSTAACSLSNSIRRSNRNNKKKSAVTCTLMLQITILFCTFYIFVASILLCTQGTKRIVNDAIVTTQHSMHLLSAASDSIMVSITDSLLSSMETSRLSTISLLESIDGEYYSYCGTNKDIHISLCENVIRGTHDTCPGLNLMIRNKKNREKEEGEKYRPYTTVDEVSDVIYYFSEGDLLERPVQIGLDINDMNDRAQIVDNILNSDAAAADADNGGDAQHVSQMSDAIDQLYNVFEQLYTMSHDVSANLKDFTDIYLLKMLNTTKGLATILSILCLLLIGSIVVQLMVVRRLRRRRNYSQGVLEEDDDVNAPTKRLMERSKMIQSCQIKVLVPLITVIVSILYVLSLVFMAGAVVTTDVCGTGGDPKNKVMIAMESMDGLPPDATSILSHYLNGCPNVDMYPEINDLIEYYTTGQHTLHDYEMSSNAIASANNGTVCDVALMDQTQMTQNHLCDAARSLDVLRIRASSCDVWYPIYQIARDSLCHEFQLGFTWMTSCAIIISIMLCIILMLAPSGLVYYDDNRRSSCCCWLKQDQDQKVDSEEAEESDSSESDGSDHDGDPSSEEYGHSDNESTENGDNET